jgi:hypothetical protein
VPTPALVQSAYNNPNSGTAVTSIAQAFTTANNTAGNLLFAVVGAIPGATWPVTVADPTNGSWTQAVKSLTANAGGLAIFYFANCAGGVKPTVTATSTVAAEYFDIAIGELSGCATVSPVDAVGPSNETGSSGTATTGNIVTTLANDIIIAGMFAYAADSGVSGTYISGAGTGFCDQYKVESTSGTYALTTTLSSTSWWSAGVAFKAASGATTLNSTWTSNPKNALTLGDQVIRHVATLINPKATLTLTDQALRYIATLIGPKSTLTMNNQVLADVALSIGPKATLTLTDQVLRKLTTAINPKATLSLNDQVLRDVTIAINPHSTLTLNDRVIRNVTLTVSPKVTLTLNAQISGSVTYLDATWFSGPAATLIMANIALADVALSIHAKSALTLTDLLALNSAISINPKAQLALSTQQLNQAQIVINPKVTLVLRGQISGQTSTQLYIFSDHFGVHRVVSSE